jgi:hypothetical protein
MLNCFNLRVRKDGIHPVLCYDYPLRERGKSSDNVRRTEDITFKEPFLNC